MQKLLLTGISILHFFLTGLSQKFEPTFLQVERRENPLGIDVSHPGFSWQIQTTQKNFLQSSYQVMVSDDSLSLAKNVANIWNSQKETSATSTGIPFAGKRLQSGTTYFWKVKVWSKNNEPSSWSKIRSFTTGLFNPTDWSGARWIGYADLPDSLILVPGVHTPDARKLGEKHRQRSVVPLFRKGFAARKNLAKAIIFVSGLGHYELLVNGKKIGNSFLAPGWTHYEKKVLYNTYDVTREIAAGGNAIGMIVGNGFYNINRERYYKLTVAYGFPKLICKLQLTYTDGTTEVVISDSSWKVAPSPILFASIFGGEDYDANLEQAGWDRVSFDDRMWKNALLVKAPAGILESEKDFPVTVSETIGVQKISEPRTGVYVYDFGQNASGIIRLHVKGKKGQTVKLVPAELLTDSGLANQNATGKPYYFSYTLKGEEDEIWTPRFTYYGFRYVQVEGAVPTGNTGGPNLPQLTSLLSLHTRNSAPSNGSFESSNGLFNRINQLIRWAIKSNMQSVVTDCPHREKLSWLEQDYLMGGSIHANYEVYHLYKKLVQDMMEAQTPEGLVPDIAPEFVFFDDKGFGFRDSPEWGSAAVIVPWLVYKWYGDQNIIRTAYPMMQKYVDYLKNKSDSHIISYGLGDWFDYGPNRPGVAQLTPKELTATAIYYYDVKLLSTMAALLSNQVDANRYAIWAAEIKKSFNEKFFNRDQKVYATGSQTSMAMPLCVGLVEENDRDAVFRNLIDSIRSTEKKLTAGDIGFHFLVKALHEGGASQLLYEMNYRDDVPGYGFQLRKGATALTESWPALPQVSNNHLMLGHIMEWFYSGLGGINQSENSIAYKEVIIRPEIVGDLTYVKASRKTVYGNIRSEWKKINNGFEYTIDIPANTSATAFLPATSMSGVWVNGELVSTSKLVKAIGLENGRIIIKMGSGEYQFRIHK